MHINDIGRNIAIAKAEQMRTPATVSIMQQNMNIPFKIFSNIALKL